METFAASYFDGESAALASVIVSPGADGLRIDRIDGSSVGVWAWGDLRLTSRFHLDDGFVLRSKAVRMARLSFAGRTGLAVFEAGAPQLGRPRLASRRNGRRLAIWAGTLGVAALLVIFAWPSLAALLTSLVPASIERDVGARIEREIVAVFAEGRCTGSAGARALDRLVARLAAHADPDAQFLVSVARAPIVNAVALPGNRIVLFSGLIAEAESPDEVAGVLAHEMGHVVLRHPTEAWVQSVGLTAIFDALVGGTAGEQMIGGLANVLTQAAFSRDAEAEADGFGLDVLHEAGIDTAPLARFFERLEEEHGEGSMLLASHPSLSSRAALARAPQGRTRPALDAGSWAALREICG